jgi:hypothetical protein
MGVAEFGASIRWRPSGLLLHSIKLGDPADGLFGDGRALRPVDVDELAPDMGHAGNFADGAGAVEVFEPGIAIGMHPATESGEMVLRVLALAISREPIPSRRWRLAAPWAFITGIGPEPGRLGFAGAWCEHADRGVVGKDCFGRQDMAADGIGKGLKQSRRFANPVGQGGAIQIEPFAVKDLALSVKRQVISIFADQHVGQETRSGAATLDRARRQRRLHEAFAARTG